MAKKNRVRRWLRVIHRDVGYLAAPLTIVYAVSGVAVNHVADWNPNVTVERETLQIGPAAGLSAEQVLERLGEPPAHKSTFRPDGRTLQIFTKEATFTVDLPTGRVGSERAETRPVIYETNFLHLNHAKKAWTWIADIFAVALAFLALSGVFLIKGKKGLVGRGKWFLIGGAVIPLWALWLYL